MTLERVIGYSGLLLVVVHVLPFEYFWVDILSIILGIGLILAATYLRWKNKINRYINSHQGTMSIPHLFQRLEQEGRNSRTDRSKDK